MISPARSRRRRIATGTVPRSRPHTTMVKACLEDTTAHFAFRPLAMVVLCCDVLLA